MQNAWLKVKSYAPTRLSLFGGGTDLPVYYEKYGGLVVSMAINLRQRIKIIKGDGSRSKQFIFPPYSNLGYYTPFLKEFGLNPDSIMANFDGVLQSGLGSSGSAAVALVAGLARMVGLNLTREQIAEKAWEIESKRVGLYTGKQDQYAAAFGGFNRINFKKDKVEVIPFNRDVADLVEKSILLFETGVRRSKGNIQEQLKELSKEQIKALDKIKSIAEKSVSLLESKDIYKVGLLFKDYWEAKKASNPLISSYEIENIYNTAMQSGSIGGKLMGSGGGGFMFFIVEPKSL